MENSINHMPWPTEVWEDYLHRSREMLLKDGLTVEDMNNDQVAKNYVINYIEAELFNKDKAAGLFIVFKGFKFKGFG